MTFLPAGEIVTSENAENLHSYRKYRLRAGVQLGVQVCRRGCGASAREVFVRRNHEYLCSRHIADPQAEVFARSVEDGRQHILFIEDQIPLRMLGSGFVRSNDVIRMMVELGHHVTVFPMASCSFDPAAIYADFPEAVEVMHDRSFDYLGALLEGRKGYYDTVWVVRAHNLDRVRPILDGVVVDSDHPPQVVLDTEAVFAVREALHEALKNGKEARVEDNAIAREFKNAELCRHIIAVNESESAILRRLVAPPSR
jgi:hypothetical protein